MLELFGMTVLELRTVMCPAFLSAQNRARLPITGPVSGFIVGPFSTGLLTLFFKTKRHMTNSLHAYRG